MTTHPTPIELHWRAALTCLRALRTCSPAHADHWLREGSRHLAALRTLVTDHRS